MTSNLAGDIIRKYARETASEEMMVAKLEKDESKKKQAYKNIRAKMTEEVDITLKKAFKPEFLNRLDEVIIFESLTIEEIAKIVDLQIAGLQKRLGMKKIKIILSENAKINIAKNGFDPDFGARPLRRYIQNKIENPMAIMLIENKLEEGSIVKIDEKDGNLLIVKNQSVKKEH